MTGPRRAKLEMLIDVLKVISAHGPLRPTHVMHKANLTWQTLKLSIATLKSLGAITEEVLERGIVYRIRDPGASALQDYFRLQETLGILKAPVCERPVEVRPTVLFRR